MMLQFAYFNVSIVECIVDALEIVDVPTDSSTLRPS
jgi:hypothetical protein